MDKEYLLKKWLSDEITSEEAKAFNALENAAFYREIIEEAQRFSGDSNMKVETFGELDKKLASKPINSINWIKAVSAIAAIFIIGFALFALFNNDQINTFKTDLAQRETITLPDNSVVNLNALSELEFNVSNWDNVRALKLKGEAFFDVEKGKRFDVNTDFGTVSVLGTEFNVLSRDRVFKVSCYEGSVQVTYNNNQVELPAGTEFLLEAGKGLKSNIGVAEPYWLKHMSVFENVAFNTVIKEIEKQYDVKVRCTSDLNLKFTGAFEHDNLENALKSITKPLNLTFIIQSNTKEVIIRDE